MKRLVQHCPCDSLFALLAFFQCLSILHIILRYLLSNDRIRNWEQLLRGSLLMKVKTSTRKSQARQNVQRRTERIRSATKSAIWTGPRLPKSWATGGQVRNAFVDTTKLLEIALQRLRVLSRGLGLPRRMQSWWHLLSRMGPRNGVRLLRNFQVSYRDMVHYCYLMFTICSQSWWFKWKHRSHRKAMPWKMA